MMSMAQTFMNTTFTSLDDLYNVDKKINDIEDSRKQLKDAANAQHREAAEQKKEAVSTADTLVQKLDEISKNDDLAGINALIAQYGDLEIFDSVKGKMVERIELERMNKLYQSYKDVNGRLVAFEEAGEFTEDGLDEVHKQVVQYTSKNLEDDMLSKEEAGCELGTVLQGKWVSVEDEFNEYSTALNRKLSDIISEHYKMPMEEEYKQALIGWDDEEQRFDTATTKKYNEDMAKLLQVQLADPVNGHPEYPNTIWAMDCLCGRLKVRFVYHFEGDNDTNRLDKPEYALEYIEGYLQKTLPLVRILFGQTFAKYYPHESIDTWFITSVLACMREKLRNDRNLCLKSDQLLSHLVATLQKFDQSLVHDFSYAPIPGKDWPGLTYDLILSNDVVFNKWLDNERDFVNHRFDEIINDKDAFQIDYDFSEKGKTQPTKSAISMQNLLEGITSNYENLPLHYQLKFLSGIQLKLYNEYFNVLKNGKDALDTVPRNDEVGMIKRMCRVWCSARCMVELMGQWGEQLFFVELWNSINPENESNNTFFDSIANGYKKEILDQMPQKLRAWETRQMNRTMKAYFEAHINWSLVTTINTNPDELELPIQTMNNDLNILAATLSKVDFLRAKLQFSQVIARYFEKNFVGCNTFNTLGAVQLQSHFDEFYERLGLSKDYAYYQRVSEELYVYSSGQNFEMSKIHVLSEDEVNDLMRRRA